MNHILHRQKRRAAGGGARLRVVGKIVRDRANGPIAWRGLKDLRTRGSGELADGAARTWLPREAETGF
jgi:hypothetical protein